MRGLPRLTATAEITMKTDIGYHNLNGWNNSVHSLDGLYFSEILMRLSSPFNINVHTYWGTPGSAVTLNNCMR
jgi:hypothetical protein